MGVTLGFSELYVPPFVRRAGLERLFRTTADAFQVIPPSLGKLSFEDGLRRYAQFTREHAVEAIKRGSTTDLEARLFENARRMGKGYRKRFHLHTMEDAMRMSRVIYRMLEIDFHGDPGGEVLVRSCFFSAYYSSQVCRLVSALDAGLLAGLSGGGRLSFSGRITEGAPCCTAYLSMAGS